MAQLIALLIIIAPALALDPVAEALIRGSLPTQWKTQITKDASNVIGALFSLCLSGIDCSGPGTGATSCGGSQSSGLPNAVNEADHEGCIVRDRCSFLSPFLRHTGHVGALRGGGG